MWRSGPPSPPCTDGLSALCGYMPSAHTSDRVVASEGVLGRCLYLRHLRLLQTCGDKEGMQQRWGQRQVVLTASFVARVRCGRSTLQRHLPGRGSVWPASVAKMWRCMRSVPALLDCTGALSDAVIDGCTACMPRVAEE